MVHRVGYSSSGPVQFACCLGDHLCPQMATDLRARATPINSARMWVSPWDHRTGFNATDAQFQTQCSTLPMTVPAFNLQPQLCLGMTCYEESEFIRFTPVARSVPSDQAGFLSSLFMLVNASLHSEVPTARRLLPVLQESSPPSCA
jgi:hypothetical protein